MFLFISINLRPKMVSIIFYAWNYLYMYVFNTASWLCNMTKLLGNDVTTYVRDYYSIRLRRLLLCTCHILSHPHAYFHHLSPYNLSTAVPMGSSVHLDATHNSNSLPSQFSVTPYESHIFINKVSYVFVKK